MKRNKGLVLVNIILTSFLLACDSKDIKGNWENIVVPTNAIKGISHISDSGNKTYESVPPFNTSMYLKYFYDEKLDENTKEDIKTNLNDIYINEVIRLHKIFDRHYYYEDENKDLITNVKTLNDSYGTGKAIKCSDELYDLIKLGVEGFTLSDGLFNIFTGSLTDYWDNVFYHIFDYYNVEDYDPYYSESQKTLLDNLVLSIPKTREEVERQLTFDDENKTITFNKIVEYDDTYRPIISVGGLAKGYATDLIKQKLVDNGYTFGTLFSGGSSIATLGSPIHSKKLKGQKVSVKNPAKSNIVNNVAAFSYQAIEEFCTSTSGNYTTNQSYSLNIDDNVIYRHHIINPYTGLPESYHRSVTLISYDLSSATLDILSTAFMNLDVKDGLVLRKKIIEKLDCSLDIIYLDQQGTDKNAIVSAIATSNINGTLEVEDGVKLIYEE